MIYSYEIRIPRERVAVLIGRKGETKKVLEKSTSSTIIVDSKEGEITVQGEDAIKLYTAREIILAIGRGFSPEAAMKLLKPDYILEIIRLNDYAKTKASLVRLKGRIIGEGGRSRRTIESLTETNISVYGKTVAVIGLPENLSVCRRALESLLTGSPHRKVYSWLERMRSKMKSQRFMGGL